MEKMRKRRNTGRVTLQEVAHYAGVGSMTVSRALRMPEQVSDKLREKIEKAVETLGYIPNRAAGALASGYSNVVVVLIPSLIDKASSKFMQALQQILNKNEFQLLLGCHEYNQRKEAEILMTLLKSNPAAVVIFGSQLTEKTYQLLERANIPTVNVVGSYFKGAKMTLAAASFESAYELTRYLLERGYHHIGYVGAYRDNRLQHQQLNGWHKAMLDHYKNADQIVTTPDMASLQFGRYALTEILLRLPELDAVICSHEDIALGVLFECQQRLLKIPGDIAVACLDGSDSCDQTHPTLTSMRIDYKKMGRETGKMLIELLNNDEDGREDGIINQTFSYKFERRQST
ncbi:LacI family DNA-binding transcriptional regulator [Serratia symbiotica]|uniref:LacI family DNA-binding transcriptional regulator n=1 Tax=Serratia symbiotica TaxID=138074 RepID=A0A068Z133_9GAMM|nr:LacI family DNA-binding transcriptional regulator [Serratia symbiotica]QLH62901.1 LacI family DNA-binding transcriptional regulator [Serratia symbiotica]CDS57509.1 Sugar-binding transcriptional regulator, LacI family [Serratia symbiotica]